MIHLARVVLAAGDAPATRALHESFHRNNYTGGLFHDADAAFAEIRRERPDVVVLGPGLRGRDADGVLNALRNSAETRDVPVFMLTDRPAAEVGERLLEAGADDVAQASADPRAVLTRLRSLVRIATMREELAARAALNADLGLPEQGTASQAADTPPLVLVAGAAAAETVRTAIAEADVVGAPDLIEGLRMLEDRRFDAMVLWAGDHVEAYLDFCIHIRRNPRLFNLPVVFCAGADAMADPLDALDHGASHVVMAPPAPAELRFALRALVRRQRLRWALRDALAATHNDDVGDDLVPEVYAAAYLERYLARRLPHAQAHRRQFSLVGFSFAGIETVRQEFGADSAQNLLEQLGQWLTLLVRAEDLVARGDGSRFWIVLPDTPVAEAEIVMQRIAGVIANTDLAVRDVYRVVNVWPFVAATGLTRTDTVHSLMERVTVQLCKHGTSVD